MATKRGGECAAHGAGYRVAKKVQGLRCSNCRRLIADGEWYRVKDGDLQHAKACATHPEIAKERKAREQATAR